VVSITALLDRSAIIFDLEAVLHSFSVNTFDDNIADDAFDALHYALTARAFLLSLLLVDNTSPVTAYDVYETEKV